MPIDGDKEFAAYVVDLFQEFGPVRAKRMFGGYGIFYDGLMIGLIADDVLYLKVAPESEGTFEKKGLEPFTYDKKGKPVKMSYRRAPDEAMEDAEEMVRWAELAHEAAVRAKK